MRGAAGDWMQSSHSARPQYEQTATASALCLEHFMGYGAGSFNPAKRDRCSLSNYSVSLAFNVLGARNSIPARKHKSRGPLKAYRGK